MINLKNGFHIIETLSELPDLRNRREIFCDIESKRVFDNDKVGGMYPFKGDKICGFSVSADDMPEVFYVPVRHTAECSNNLPVKNVMNWARDILTSCHDWINHYVKFDAMMFDIGDDVQFDCRLVCTCNLAKLVYSDRTNYKLKPLCVDWLNYDTGSLDRVQAYLKKIKSKSYADVPIELLGEYCNDDVRMNRLLYRFLQKEMQTRIEKSEGTQGEAVQRLIETEINLTSVLFDIEKEGLKIDVDECRKESIKSLTIMIDSAEKIQEATGLEEFTNSNACMQEILLKQLKLPVLLTIKEKEDGQYIDTGRPSFDKDAMALYKNHPSVTSNPKTQELINVISSYRTEQQFKSLFLDTFLELNVDGIIHPNYNQSVRTGRLSCSKPNSQQQNERSKKLIHPFDGEGFISNDYSQIEYRLVVHYANIVAAIKAYNENPLTDYHKWVAELLGIVRKPAKQLNFGMVYGEGKKAVTKTLSSNEDIIKTMGDKVNELINEGLLAPELRVMKFNELCKTHSEDSYDIYHERFPEIKALSKRAIKVAIQRGFIFTAYGRRRYLPGTATYKALNSIAQGTAADIIKERMVAFSPRYNSESKKWGIKIRANVHDELLNGVPLENLRDPKLYDFIYNMLETTTVKFRVPILVGLGVSEKNWSEAAGGETTIENNGKLIEGKLSELKIKFPDGNLIAGKIRGL